MNGIKIAMKDLQALLEAHQYEGIKTFLATGNIIAMSDLNTKELVKKDIERLLTEKFRYEAHVLIRSNLDLTMIFDESEKYSVQANEHKYVLLCDTEESVLELEQLFQEKGNEKEAFYTFGNNAFWIVEKENTLGSEFGSKVLGSKKYKSLVTSRNINTIEKMVLYMRQNELL